MFKWQEYCLLASNLLVQAINSDNDQKESILRSAVSRAYYAAFHIADDYLQETGKYPSAMGNKTSTEGSHKRVIDVFINNTANPTWGEIGKLLNRLKGARHWADYNPWNHAGTGVEFRDPEAIARKLQEAEEVIRLIKSLSCKKTT